MSDPLMAGPGYPGPMRFDSRVVGGDEVRAIRAAQVSELTSILAVSAARAETLLRAANWNIEEAAVRAVDSGGDDAAAAAVADAPACRAWTQISCNSATACATCFDDDGATGRETDCGGVLCDDCWTRYFRAMLTSGPDVVVCPMPKCNTIVPGVLVKAVLRPAPGNVTANGTEATAPVSFPASPPPSGTNLSHSASEVSASPEELAQLSNSILLDRYLSRQLKDYLVGSSDLRECPGKGCDGIVKRLDADQTDVTCDRCESAFCWKCGLESHSPLDCKNAKEWCLHSSNDVRRLKKERCALRGFCESKSRWWIIQNTKACPRCHVDILKNGGCNHMHCRNCGHDFNWDKPSERVSHHGPLQPTSPPLPPEQAEASSDNLRARAAAFKGHKVKANEFAHHVPAATLYAQSMGADESVVRNAHFQVMSAHRELQWVHMAMYFCECPASAKGLIEHNVAALESEVRGLEDRVIVSNSTWSARDIVKQTSLVHMYRRSIKNLTSEMV